MPIEIVKDTCTWYIGDFWGKCLIKMEYITIRDPTELHSIDRERMHVSRVARYVP